MVAHADAESVCRRLTDAEGADGTDAGPNSTGSRTSLRRRGKWYTLYPRCLRLGLFDVCVPSFANKKGKLTYTVLSSTSGSDQLLIILCTW